MPSKQFESFIVGLGLRRQIAADLWDANIQTPQELAGMDAAQLKKVTDFPLLVNTIHPVLQKYVFNITMAKDPYTKALAVVKKHAMVDDDEDPTSAASFISADSTVGDSVPTAGAGNACSIRPVNGGSTGAHTQQTYQLKYNMSTYDNNSTRMKTSGAGNMTQTHIGYPSNTAAIPPRSDNRIMIAGGNFVQANIMGTGPVTYNNTNTVINTSSTPDVDLEKRRATFLNDSFFFNGTMVKASDLHWLGDDDNFWINDIKVQSADMETYTRHIGLDDAYDVRNHGSSRALILNNINFRTRGMSCRAGADRDGTQMESLLSELGFQVRHENNKTAAEMRELLREFAASRGNIKADMVVVYIGSHGERDEYGNDTFVGVDGWRMKLGDVRDMFSPANCPLLIKKPKMFFLQFCRQDNGRKPMSTANPLPQSMRMQTNRWRISSDAEGYRDQSKSVLRENVGTAGETRTMDMLFVYATLAGSKAYRDTEDGSWFVTALVRVITESANKEDILSMLTKVNNMVSANMATENETKALQMSEVVNTLRKKVFFYPGLEV